MRQTPTCTPDQLLKINTGDLVQKFAEKISQVSPLLKGSMIRAYKTALQDAQLLLIVASKDTQDKDYSAEAPK